MTASVPVHDRLVCRLPEDERRRCLDAIRPGTTVLVEHSWSRKLDDASSLVGEVLGVAYSPGGGVSQRRLARLLQGRRGPGRPARQIRLMY
jgi:hypothetical protein